jgi:ABC-type proline/glycine betaine transport system permease subunit
LKSKGKIIALSLLLLLLILLAISREYTFVWINAAINNYHNTSNNSEIPAFLFQFKKQELYTLKWILSIFFGGLNILFSVLAIHIYFKSKIYTLLIFSLYALAGLTLAIGYPLSKLFNTKDSVYGLLHDILVLMQTPIIFILVFPLFLFHKKQNLTN